MKYILDKGKIVSIEKDDGKPVKAGFMRGLRNAQKTSYWFLLNAGTGMNWCSGVEVELNDIERSVFNWCYNWYARYESGRNPETPIQTFDDMKYGLLELNPDAYMKLLD